MPADFVQAFTEQDHIGEHRLVEVLVHLLGDLVQVKRENFVNEHLASVLVSQVVVVSVNRTDVVLEVDLLIELGFVFFFLLLLGVTWLFF